MSEKEDGRTHMLLRVEWGKYLEDTLSEEGEEEG